MFRVITGKIRWHGIFPDRVSGVQDEQIQIEIIHSTPFVYKYIDHLQVMQLPAAAERKSLSHKPTVASHGACFCSSSVYKYSRPEDRDRDISQVVIPGYGVSRVHRIE